MSADRHFTLNYQPRLAHAYMHAHTREYCNVNNFIFTQIHGNSILNTW